MSQGVSVTLSFDQCSMAKKRRVTVADVASVIGNNQTIVQRIEGYELFVFNEKKQKKTFSVLFVIKNLQAQFPEVSFSVLGETDFIVEYKPEKKGTAPKVLEWGKTVFVCLTVFFGSAFTIMTFNKDASVEEVFSLIYKLSEGAERSRPGELEIAYSIGLPIGIILFFNHFLRKKIDSDPTPLQVQMRQYEKDVNATIIENATREGKKKDG